MPPQPHNHLKRFLLSFPSFLPYNNITMPSLNSPSEAFEPYASAASAAPAPPAPPASRLEATEASSSAESSSDGEADDASVDEVSLNTSKHPLTIWAVIYANIK